MVFYVSNQKKLINSEHYIQINESKAVEFLIESNIKELEIDTETRGLCPHLDDLLCVQIGNGVDEFVFEYNSITEIFKNFLKKDDLLFIAHNVKFDYKFLIKIDVFLKNVYCTQLAEQVITNGKDEPFNLNFLCEKYLNVKLNKEVRNDIIINGLTDKAIIYAANDVKHLKKIKEIQLKKIEEISIENNINLIETLNLENEVVKVFSFMEYNGIRLDIEKWNNINIEVKKKLIETETLLDEEVTKDKKLEKFVPKTKQLNLFGFEERLLKINWKSPQQKLKILNCLGFDVNSTGAEILQKLKNKSNIIKMLLDYNKLSKLDSSFGKKLIGLINTKTKRIHPDYWQIVETGRISCKNPNLLNIPSKGELGPLIRSAFITRKGYKWVGGDYSGMELCIIADLSNDDVWVSALNNGEDLHSKLCSATFNIPIEDVKKPFPYNPSLTYRDVQKTINFGIAYGMSEFKLSDRLNISKKEALKIITAFKSNVPTVSKFLEKMAKFGLKKGFIHTPPPFNRIRYFNDWVYYKQYDDSKIKGSIERKSYNTPIQGMNADIIKAALINVQKEIDINGWDVFILLSVYDEINTECVEEQAEDWKIKLEEIMISTAKKYIKNVPIKADCYVSDYWKK